MIEQKHLNLLSVVLLAMFILFRYIEAVTVDVNCRDDADEKTNAAAPLLASQSHILEAGSNALSDLGGPPIFDQFSCWKIAILHHDASTVRSPMETAMNENGDKYSGVPATDIKA